jgi:non-ribosomal peptide synthetase component F
MALDRGEPLNPVSLSDVFVGVAEQSRDRPAVVSPHLALTYGELIARAARSARALHSQGVVAGARIGLSIRYGAETVV